MIRNFSYVIASWFGAGYSPFASGTVGSIFSIPFIFIVIHLFGVVGVLISCIFLFALGVVTSAEVLKYTTHDPSLIVIDEVVGMFVTFIPIAFIKGDIKVVLPYYILGFILFRIFDIFKFGLVKWADTKLNNAYGVMLDDVFAGIYAAAVLVIILHYIFKVI